ncbi:sensor histidine kinase [Geomesophilobacter sediminis]|uniref:histidine kinase n=1 Tax=Geomesophilobacter sediminis TaxID=2798584 RepID=A0A8J7IRS9_9BACT|nr:ATP-binding protein [Geomesophilobacter sediminis]MBJ6725764.1 HAMP domain-containing protein [Geomesophilobacter sediminis]
MRQRLLWQLLISHLLLVLLLMFLGLWSTIRDASEQYTKAVAIAPDLAADAHALFLEQIRTYVIRTALLGAVVSAILSYLLIRWALRPLSQMATVTRQLAEGNFSERVDVVSRYEAGRLATEFNRMADNLEKVERLRKNMVADIAHELRTPLTNLRGYLEGLSDSVIQPTEKTFRMLEQEVLRLVHLVEDLQQLARADAARAFLALREVSLHQLLRQIMDLYRPNFEQKGMRVDWRLEPGTELVSADQDKLMQAIRNLVDNAWKYSPEEGTVTIITAPCDDGVKTTFINRGGAISQEDIPFVFERFFRGDRSRSRDAGGAGIGLAIVKELIEAHGGSVGASSNGDGTRVWFVLPR